MAETPPADGSASTLSAPDRRSPERVSRRGKRLPADLPTIANYEWVRVLGRGGMGLVLEARDRNLDRAVAVKLPLSRGASRRGRFLREARSAARLRHPNVCAIHEVGEVDGRPYIVMDLIRGKTLGEWALEEKPNARRSAEIVAKLARAVSYAHQHSVIHRDLKPSNVMLDAETGEPVLMDFGLAKGTTFEDSQLTRSGQIVGTPAYMAPEQAAGQRERIGPASDVYSLGAILYELVGGRRPFEGTTGEVLWKVQVEEPAALRKVVPKVHRDLETICLKGMAKEPSERYASAGDLALDLERFCAGESIVARRQSAASRLWRSASRRPLVSALILAAVAALAVGGWLAVHAMQARETATLLANLEAELDADDWSAEHLAAMDRTLDALQARAPAQADAGRARLVQRFSEAIRRELGRPSLPADAADRVNAMVDLLAVRDSEEAESLRAALERRLRAWQDVFHLAPPFAGWREVFEAADVRLDGEAMVRTDSPDDERSVVPTRVPSAGPVRLEAVFDPRWEEANRLGLDLGFAPATPGHRLVLAAAGPVPDDSQEDAPPPSFAQARAAGGSVRLTLLRGGMRLRETDVPAADLPEGTLRLSLSKIGDELRASVGERTTMRFVDAFNSYADTAVFALQWPPGVGLVELRAMSQSLPPEPSPLQRGDQLYAAGRFADALAAYRDQAAAFAAGASDQEVRYKQAMSLLALGRAAEAEAALEPLAAEPGSRWPVLAACQIWLQRVRDRRFDETDAIYENLAARRGIDELVALVPVGLHEKIVTGYSGQSTGLNLYRPNPHRIRQAERALAIGELFGSRVNPNNWVEQQLIRAYRASRQEDRALTFAEKTLRGAPPGRPTSGMNSIVPEYCWLLRLDGKPKKALAEIDRWLARESQRDPTDPHSDWRLERVRTLAALERWDEAEGELEAMLAAHPPQRIGPMYPAACGLLGFLRQRRGDSDGARQAWESVSKVPWQTKDFNFSTLDALIVASLAGEMPKEAVETLMTKLASSGGDAPLAAAQTLLGGYLLPPETVAAAAEDAFQRPRGREIARQVLFREVPFADCLRQPLLLLMVEMASRGAFDGRLSEAEQSVIWEAVERGFDAVFVDGSLGKSEILQLALAWKGMTNFLGWSALAARLDPALRGPVAYVLGHRYRKLDQPDEAMKFFETARADAPAESALAELAQSQLAALAAPPPGGPAKPPVKAPAGLAPVEP